MSQLFQELKRRNVFRVALAYLAAGWLVLQVVQLVLESTSAPDWVMQVFLLAIAVGFPFAILFAWAFELTPEGIKREKEVDRDRSITDQTGRKLNRTIIVVLAAAVAFLLVDKFVLQHDTQSTLAATDKSVAVLPFVAMSSGPDDEYFADGLIEEILNSLTRVPELLVTARTSAFHFKGKDDPVPEIAAALGVAHIVEGSVRRSGERLRVTAQLIRADDGFHLWSETYDHDTSDVFGVQTDIAEKIATALDVVLDEDQLAAMRSVGLQNPEAYVAFQKGIELFDGAHGSQGQTEKLLVANEWFEKTMELAPDFSDAYTYHADYFTHILMGDGASDRLSADELAAAMASVEEDLTRAMRFAPDESRRAVYGWDLDVITGRWRGLRSRFDQLIAQGGCNMPNWPEVLTSPFGRAADVRLMTERVIECNPLDFSGWMSSAHASQWLGDFDAAVEISKRGWEATGHRILIYRLIEALIGAGRFDEASQVIESEVRDETSRLMRLRRVAVARGDAEQAEVLMGQIERATQGRDFFLAAYATSGQRERANEMAAELDARPFGYLILMRVVSDCICGAPFDLDVTPNYARLVREGDLAWPPQSPIDWPLKDW